MSNLTVAAFFTRNTGSPATGLTLADISFYLTRQHRTTGVDRVIWDGTQNPTEEVDNVGSYIRVYSEANFDLYLYFARALYGGAVGLDSNHVVGIVSNPSPWEYSTRDLSPVEIS